MINIFNAATFVASAENGLTFDPAVMFEINGIQVTETVTTTWAVMAILVVLSILATRNMSMVPKGLQHFFEVFIDGIHYLLDSTMGYARRGFAPYIMALAMFLILSNITGLIGIRQPTADLNTTFALSILTFVLTQFYAWKNKGLGKYIKETFFSPVPLLAPLFIVGELANPVSLGFRLFGNMLGGLVMMGLIYHFAPWFVPVLPHLYLDVFAGLIQALIFVMLTMTYITMGMD
ncbi:F0F1 ATP synthase subunit A [Candidatus Contubernalis alkaliaceticus]|uniref:F0F1 ATP synthase subunit A n=1 Tax=Candidatus Contubernalis alkaliaceticus TaxID=338645 RepID=UPI001F4BDD9C|nr:F0F1 ATP synthase subunit A [Candidatus Contubernalis alkalaceticus]UNC93665.1 F0F1 ATP synthase subunit A [Candidatus Contubernalis alkalaceticus]